MNSDDSDDDARTRKSDPKAAHRISAHQQESKPKHTPPDWLDRLLTPQPVRLSLSLKRLLVSQFTADTLHTLAWLKEHDSPGMTARRSLSNASVEELAEMLTTGRKPTYGWWTRHMDVAA
jgi:hypothetical protein